LECAGDDIDVEFFPPLLHVTVMHHQDAPDGERFFSYVSWDVHGDRTGRRHVVFSPGNGRAKERSPCAISGRRGFPIICTEERSRSIRASIGKSGSLFVLNVKHLWPRTSARVG